MDNNDESIPLGDERPYQNNEQDIHRFTFYHM